MHLLLGPSGDDTFSALRKVNTNTSTGPDNIPAWVLKLTFRQYPTMHTNYIISHCTTLQYNHNI